MKKSGASRGQSASDLISNRIAELGDWRGKTLGRMRKLIREADPDVVEEWKWMGTPVWSHDGIICTGEAYKAIVELTFAKGASLEGPAKPLNSSLDGNVRRAVDIPEGGKNSTRSSLILTILVAVVVGGVLYEGRVGTLPWAKLAANISLQKEAKAPPPAPLPASATWPSGRSR